MHLDRIDCEILRQLRKNARLPNKTLAERIGVAPSTTLERVRRLRESSVIVGYHAEIEPVALGIGLQAMVSVRLDRHSRADLDAFHAYLLTLNEVMTFYHVAGRNDYLVHVAVRDSNHLRDFAMDAFTTRPEVAHIETSLIFSFQRNADLPIYTDIDNEQASHRSAR